jgi:plasmid stabilization system protein ParE
MQMAPETNSRTVATTKKAASAKYALHIPTALERRLKRCRETVRTAIRTQLQDIADSAGNGRKVKPLTNGTPGLRFYIHESYKISYEVDAKARRVILLGLGRVTT